MSSSAPGWDTHDLLPFYLNGTLSAEEVRAFESHLMSCGDCRKEKELLEELRSRIERHGEDYFADHPDPEQIVAAALGTLAGDGHPEVLRHLALCPTCAAEIRLVRRGPDEDVAIETADGTRTPPSRWGRAVAAFAAGVLLTVLAVTVFEDPGPGLMDPLQSYPVDPELRGVEAATVSPKVGNPWFQIYFHVDLDRSLLPLDLEIRSENGEPVLSLDGIDAVDEAGFVFLPLFRSSFPDGEYLLSVRSSVDPDARVDYRFRVLQRP